MLTWVTLVLIQTSFARAAEQVDLLLVLAMDVSRSMDQAKFQLQRQGYAAAISDPQVLHAIDSGPHQKIVICFIDWSGPFEQKLVIDWSIIDGPAAAARFADLIIEAPRSFYNSTSISYAIDFAAAQIARAPFEAERHAIDVSGDGTNNSGRDASRSINLGNGRGFSVAEVVRTTEKVTGRSVRAEMCPRRAGDPPVLVSDSSKARKLLGWTPRYPDLDQQITHAWAWFRDKMPNV